MRTAKEIKMLRSGKGFFTLSDMVNALSDEGVSITKQAYSLKERGRTPFTAKEIDALSRILGMSLDEAFSFFA